MKKATFPDLRLYRTAALLLILPALFLLRPVPALAAENIHLPQFAGSFYPADPEKLSDWIRTALEEAPAPSAGSEIPFAVIVPHAAYQYSGRIAAAGYRQVEERSYDTVILLGPNHNTPVKGAAIWEEGGWKSPLGLVNIDTDLAKAIDAGGPDFVFDRAPHLNEHSLEVQIPFIQTVLPDALIVPIVLNNSDQKNCLRLAGAIARAIQASPGKKILIVVSTDLSHYFPLERAESMDRLAIEAVSSKDSLLLAKHLGAGRTQLCGDAAVLTLIEILKLFPQTTVSLVRHGTSADSTGDTRSVVGYAAMLAVRPAGTNESSAPPSPVSEMLSPEAGRKLLAMARETLESVLRGGSIPPVAAPTPEITAKKGVFVTLEEHGDLRGCIGNVVPKDPLYLAVQKRAVDAALHDGRFPPVKAGELDNISIEASILHEPRPVRNASEIRMGMDGVVLYTAGGQGGLFLPEVADHFQGERTPFLETLCTQKAGADKDCWKDPGTRIYVFETQKFAEEEKKP